jgi:hypothetical protein
MEEQAMKATYSVKIGNEVYVYVLGRLVMKRWLKTGVSATFHVAPSGVHWNTDKR